MLAKPVSAVTVNVRDAPAPVEDRKPLICEAGRASAPDSSKTVLAVVPYRLPLLSMIRAASGFSPLVPLNEASVVIVLLPWASSKTVPSSVGASPRRGAVQVAAAVHDHAADYVVHRWGMRRTRPAWSGSA